MRPCFQTLCRGSILALALASFPCLAASETPVIHGEFEVSASETYRGGYERVLDQDWPEAARSFARLLARHPDSEWADDASFWQCYAGERLGRASSTVFDCFANLLTLFPESEWADDAHRNLVRLGQELARQGSSEYQDRARILAQGAVDPETLKVLEALAHLDDAEAVALVLRQIERTEDPGLRARMVDSLEDIESPEVVQTLQGLVERDPAIEVRLTALETLGDLGRVTSDYLIQIAGSPYEPVELRILALDELSNDDTSPALRAMLREVALDEATLETALWAVAILGDLTEPRALEVLAEVLDSVRDPKLRLGTLKAVSEHEGGAALELLRGAIDSDPDNEVSWEAVPMLAEHETRAAFSALETFSGSSFPEPLRAGALDGLAEFESARAAEVIADVLLTTDDEALRKAAIAAAGKNGHDAAVEPLLRAAEATSDSRVRSLVLRALDEIGSRRARAATIELQTHSPQSTSTQ